MAVMRCASNQEATAPGLLQASATYTVPTAPRCTILLDVHWTYLLELRHETSKSPEALNQGCVPAAQQHEAIDL
jgi:hypothetical protein